MTGCDQDPNVNQRVPLTQLLEILIVKVERVVKRKRLSAKKHESGTVM